MTGNAAAAQIRAGLDHPIIDADAHWLEPGPVCLEYLREVGGRAAIEVSSRRFSAPTRA